MLRRKLQYLYAAILLFIASGYYDSKHPYCMTDEIHGLFDSSHLEQLTFTAISKILADNHYTDHTSFNDEKSDIVFFCRHPIDKEYGSRIKVTRIGEKITEIELMDGALRVKNSN